MLTPCINAVTLVPSDSHPRTHLDGESIQQSHVVYMKAHGLPRAALVGKVIMHTCDNPRCINIEHLVLGTQADNIDDMWRKGRQGVQPMKGVAHPLALLTTEQVLDIRDNRAVIGKDMAKRYNISTATVSMIRTGKIWKHLPPRIN